MSTTPNETTANELTVGHSFEETDIDDDEMHEEKLKIPSRKWFSKTKAFEGIYKQNAEEFKQGHARLSYMEKNNITDPDFVFDPELADADDKVAYKNSEEWKKVEIEFNASDEKNKAEIKEFKLKYPGVFEKIKEEKAFAKANSKLKRKKEPERPASPAKKTSICQDAIFEPPREMASLFAAALNKVSVFDVFGSEKKMRVAVEDYCETVINFIKQELQSTVKDKV